MRRLTKIFLILIMILLAGFTVITKEENKVIESAKSNENIINENNSNFPVSNSIIKYKDMGTMTASWYGPGFHGQITANGEVYNQMAFTAAHKKLQFGTLLKLTNLKNNKSVVVRINDRGPYIPGRQLDLSKAAALSLGMVKRGVSKLKVEEIRLKGINFPVVTFN